MQVLKFDGKPIKAWIDGVPLEHEAQEQLRRTARLPFIHKHIAVMPDVHWGKGSTIGSVIPTKGAVVPAAVGVDIGCGMQAVLTNLSARDLPDNLAELRLSIEERVPVGRTADGGANDRGAWSDIPDAHGKVWRDRLSQHYEAVCEKGDKLRHNRVVHQLGTLGTGNHFIEVCLDEQDRVWIVLHSGSRGAGNRIGTQFTKVARAAAEMWHISLPDRDLAYLPEGTPEFHAYVMAVEWAQRYALYNRKLMMAGCYAALGRAISTPIGVEQTIDCHHNYIAKEHHFGENVWVTRKGAVRAREGDEGIIPGSMGAASFIVRGKGNPESFHSCSHGAGRTMSRRRAKEQFTIEDHAKATEGIECRKDVGVLDETPGAYKDVGAVMAAQADLVEVVHTLRQVLNVKG